MVERKFWFIIRTYTLVLPYIFIIVLLLYANSLVLFSLFMIKWNFSWASGNSGDIPWRIHQKLGCNSPKIAWIDLPNNVNKWRKMVIFDLLLKLARSQEACPAGSYSKTVGASDDTTCIDCIAGFACVDVPTSADPTVSVLLLFLLYFILLYIYIYIFISFHFI